ncbi:MAG: (2Fe-2S)-binding protein, partial [Gammaproteobacteria bacterium]|nr:(2Fe-2S)-binding protein [Gammaproteobacteria bacterium]
ARGCLKYAVQVDGRRVTTGAGLNATQRLTPLQESFKRHHALQCGYCVPGILISLQHCLDQDGLVDEDTVRAAMSGHLCRCTGYSAMVAAVLDVARDAAHLGGQTEDV